MPLRRSIRFLLLLPIFVKGQSCSQFGTLESTGTCSCPPGFGGSDCTQLLCSNPLLPPSSRATLDPNVSGNAAVGCNSQCTEGFEGVNCNVCLTNNACAAAIQPSSSTGGLTQGLGEPICSTGAWTWTQGFGTCAVDVSLAFWKSFSLGFPLNKHTSANSRADSPSYLDTESNPSRCLPRIDDSDIPKDRLSFRFPLAISRNGPFHHCSTLLLRFLRQHYPHRTILLRRFLLYSIEPHDDHRHFFLTSCHLLLLPFPSVSMQLWYCLLYLWSSA